MIAKRAGIRVSSVQRNWRAQVLQPDWCGGSSSLPIPKHEGMGQIDMKPNRDAQFLDLFRHLTNANSILWQHLSNS